MIVAPRADIGGVVKAVMCNAVNQSGEPSLVTAADGVTDAVAVTGQSIDRLGYDSAILVLAYNTSLTADKTFALAAEIQDSSDNSNWNTAVALQASTVEETGAASTGGNYKDVVELEVDLRGYARYVRFNFTPDLNHSGTDTADVIAIAILGGAENLDAA